MKIELTQADARGLRDFLTQLYRQQIEATGDSPYFTIHATSEFVKHHVNVFLWYLRYFPESGTILEWGSNHGPDSCLIRKVFAEKYDLHGCDFVAESEFRIFREYSRFQYSQVVNPLQLPYAENTFDVVIGSGVLEHTAMDQEALKALYSIMKPDGMLIISYLPSRWSWDEWYRRRIKKADFHRRLYGKKEIDTLLKRSGFYPLEISYQTFVPNVVDGKLPTRLKRLIAPIRRPFFSHSVLFCVAQKMIVM